MSFFGKILDEAGEFYGEVEEHITHRPLVPTHFYSAVVDPYKLVRGAWPNPSQIAALRHEGIVCVVNLCSERQQDHDVLNAGMLSVDATFDDNTAPQLATVDRFLQATTNGFTYVHCEQGIGRTGCMVAAYRVVVQGWKPADALAEAKKYGLRLESQENFILALQGAKPE
jgi:protein tyrosine/serine phosphatase